MPNYLKVAINIARFAGESESYEDSLFLFTGVKIMRLILEIDFYFCFFFSFITRKIILHSHRYLLYFLNLNF